ncbi:MAG: hypothetical protein QMD50_01195 [Patescibacteria group bacterium]|nr:hypothetical protein [Patescibacteria group bacterium]
MELVIYALVVVGILAIIFIFLLKSHPNIPTITVFGDGFQGDSPPISPVLPTSSDDKFGETTATPEPENQNTQTPDVTTLLEGGGKKEF